MDSSRMSVPETSRVLIQYFLTFLVGILLASGPIPVSTAQVSAERSLEVKIPKHLPIRVRLKKEQSFKNPKNEEWLRDLELEVTNTGDKPIYFLRLLIGLPEITAADGHNIGFALTYGRNELGQIQSKATPDDVPIQPGETYVFRLRENDLKAWDVFRKNERQTDVTKVILRFQILAFGDGMGFLGYDGKAVPPAPDTK